MPQREINKSFGRRIERRARELGLSLRQIAQKADMNPSFLTRIVAGERNPPSDEKMEKLAAALEIDPVELFFEAGRLPANAGEGAKTALVQFFRATKGLSRQQMETVVRMVQAYRQAEEGRDS